MRRLWMAVLIGGFLLIATKGFAAPLVTGVTIESVSSEYYQDGWDLRAVHVVDGSGLTGGEHAQNNGSDMNSWQTISQTGTANIVFDLGEVYPLDSLHVWNLNFYEPYNGRGAYSVSIYTSLNNSDWESQANSLFPIATGLDGYLGFNIDASSWGQARYVQFDILSNWGGSDNAGHVGLSEVQFFSGTKSAAVPVPSTLILLGSGVLALARVGRKKQQ